MNYYILRAMADHRLFWHKGRGWGARSDATPYTYWASRQVVGTPRGSEWVAVAA